MAKGRELELFSAFGVVPVRVFILISTVFDLNFKKIRENFISERTFPVAPVNLLNSESGTM